MSGDSDLNRNPSVHRLDPGSKLTHSSMGVLQAAQGSDLPIVMNEEVYSGSLTPGQQCFVLVNEGSVDSSMQRLLTEQESAMGTEVTLQEKEAALQMMQVEGTEVVPGEGRTVEVLHMDDGKTVEVVQMDGGKTLEVMHVEDASKHSEVIHVECKAGLELLNKADTVSFPPPTSSSAQPVLFSKQKGTRYMWTGPEQLAPMTVKQLRASLPNTVPASLSLRSITTVNPSIVLTTSKGSLVTGQEFSDLGCPVPYSPARKPQLMETSELQTLSDSNIVFPDSKGILSSSVEELNNAIIISWPNVSTEPKNTVATQTGPFHSAGPSINIFFCTFYADGSAQTQCDMPCLSDASVGTDGSHGCHSWIKPTMNYHFSQRNNQAVRVNGEERQLYDTRDPVNLEDNGENQRRNSKKSDQEPDFNPLETVQEESAAGRRQNLVAQKKRGRKRKRHFLSQDELEEDLEFSVEESNDNVFGIKNETVNIKMEEEDIKVEKEEVENEEECAELAQEILKTKGYGLRTKRRLKKLSDMHYLKERVVRKRRADGAAGGGKAQEFSCQVCSQVFPTFSRLQRHAKDVHDSSDFAFPCDLCGVVFTRPYNLERHKHTKHGSGERRFACEHCGRRFGRQDVLSVHITMVHFKKTFLHDMKKGLSAMGPNYVHCNSCEKIFSKEQKLKEHRQGDHTCHQCNLSFECKTSLRTHQYTRHPTACNECGKVCKSKQHMYFHRQSHAPKFKCKMCDKGFLWKSQYTIHMATHTGEKPVMCDICGKSFAHKLAVGKHKWQEHNDSNRKFKCSACGKCFVYKGKLQSHMRSHTGEKPFKCNLCSSTFSQRCNLTAHIRSIHGVYIQSIKSDGTTHTQLVKYKRTKKTPVSIVPPHTSPATVKEETQDNMLPRASVDTAAIAEAGIVEAGMTETGIVDAGIAAPGMVNAGIAVTGIAEAGIGDEGLDEEVATTEHHTHQQVSIPEQVHISESFETEAAVYQIVYAYPP